MVDTEMTATLSFKHLFGPVASRRLGLSLGIDVVPMKTCTYNCVYCQLGRTNAQTIERREYVPTEEILEELESFIHNAGHADYLTFSGSGEPTLHLKLGEMIKAAKQMTKIPVSVLTCGALLFDPIVRSELALADVVLPTLNTTSPRAFHRLNRPHGRLNLAEIYHGLRRFRKEYSGQIWIEVMLVKGYNDSREDLERLRKALDEINPDKIHLNTVARPPAESDAEPLSDADMLALQYLLGPKAEVIASHANSLKPAWGVLGVDEVVQSLARHPATLEEIAANVGCKHEIVFLVLDSLTRGGALRVKEHRGKKYYFAESTPAKEEQDSIAA